MEPGPDPAEGPGRQWPRRRRRRATAAVRGLAIDVTPLRTSRDYRLLWIGQLVSTTGRQITIVALPYQVFLLTRSPLAVGVIGLVELLPLVVCGILGGAIADRIDRRKVLIATEVGLALTTGMLLLGAVADRPPLLYLYVVAGAAAGLLGFNFPVRSASIPNLVPRAQLPAALALNQVVFNTTMIVGPALGGFILARYGLVAAYAVDLVTFAAAIAAVVLLRPLRPKRDLVTAPTSAWQDIWEGFRFVRRHRVLISAWLADLDAMTFAMPRALFPVLAITVFDVGAQGLGFLHAAFATGALLGALTAGWVGKVRHQGRAVLYAVAVWGAAITGFGLAGDAFWLALLLLAVAGGADVISAVFRGAILQLSVPDALRGRMSSVHIMVVSGGPRIGDFRSGAVASLVSPWFSVVSGGLACVVGVAALARLFPELWRYRADDPPVGA